MGKVPNTIMDIIYFLTYCCIGYWTEETILQPVSKEHPEYSLFVERTHKEMETILNAEQYQEEEKNWNTASMIRKTKSFRKNSSSPIRRADWIRGGRRIRKTNFKIMQKRKRRKPGNLQRNLTFLHHQLHQHHHHHPKTDNHQTLPGNPINNHLSQTLQVTHIQESHTKSKSLK